MTADESLLMGLPDDMHQQIAESVWDARREYERDGMARGFAYITRRHSDDALKSLIDGAKTSTSPEAYAFAQSAHQELARRNGDGSESLPDLDGATVVSLADVLPERVESLWQGRIYLGKLNVLDGDPGLGKTTIALDIASRTTRAGRMPDGTPGLSEPAAVVLITVEDGLGDTIRPRLDAVEADARLVVAITGVPDGNGNDRPVTLPDDIHLIERVVMDHAARLVIIDPLMAFLGGSTDSYRDQDIRRTLAPLSQMAERTGAAIVVNRHLSKSGGANAVYRGGGSIGIIGAARSGLIVVKDPDDETEARRILASTKNNLAAPPPALAYRIEATPAGTSYIVWEGQTTHTANQLLSMAAEDSERGDARTEAIEFLQDVLSNGPRPTSEVLKQARTLGITDATLRRARKALCIERIKEGFGEDGRWLLSLPDAPKALTEPLTRSPKYMSTLDTSERLSSPAQRFCPRCEEHGDRSLIPMAGMNYCHTCSEELERAAS